MSRRKIDQAKLQYWAGMIHDCQHSGLKTKEWLANHGNGNIKNRSSIMAIKYTEEQLNNVDKSFLVQMFLNQQEEMAKATNQVELLTNEVQSLNKKMQTLMEQMDIW